MLAVISTPQNTSSANVLAANGWMRHVSEYNKSERGNL
jgi:hypothetical protein